MSDEETTAVLTSEQIRSAFRHGLEIGKQESSNESIRVLFGFAWGNQYNDWNDIIVRWGDVLDLVNGVEEKGYGSIGSDDFFLYVGNDEIQFCHESDIHYPKNPENNEAQMICSYLKTLPPNRALKGTPLRGAP